MKKSKQIALVRIFFPLLLFSLIFLFLWGCNARFFSAFSPGAKELYSNARGPRWSPDGKRILAHSYTAGNPWYSDPILLKGSSRLRLTFNRAIEGYGSWFPDGGRIVFTRVSSGGIRRLIIRNLKSGEEDQATDMDADHPDVSPLGVSIAFDRKSEGQSRICILSLKDRSIEELTGLPLNSSFPRFDAAGRRLAFQFGSEGDQRIGIYEINSREYRSLALGDSVMKQPCWSPDGRFLVCSAKRGDGSGEELWLIDLEENSASDILDMHPLTKSGPAAIFVREPDWHPVKNLLVFSSSGERARWSISKMKISLDKKQARSIRNRDLTERYSN